MSSTTIGDGKVVTMHYRLTLDDGQVVDSSEGREPLPYLHGAGRIVPGLEAAMEGKAEGDKLEVAVPAAEGYGERNEEAVQKVPRGMFPDDARLEAGLQFQAKDPGGRDFIGTIVEATDDQVTVDFNHPLAGMNLNFAVEVVSVREATPEEKDHGHVH